MKKLLLFFVLSAFGLTGQVSHVRWSTEVKKVSDCEYDLIFKADIDKYYHIFSIVESGDTRPTIFTFTPSSDYTLVGKMKEPKPHEVDDELMGKMLEHYGKVSFTQRVKLLSDKKISIKGNFEYQICDTVACTFPPTEDFKFDLQGTASCKKDEQSSFGMITSTNACVCDTAAILQMAGPTKPSPADSAVTTEPQLSQAPADNNGSCNPWQTLVIGLGFGLGAVLMPCIYSLIPLTVSFFLKQNKNKAKGIRDAIVYGFFIILIFVVLTMSITIIFGPTALSNIATNTWLNLFFFVLFVVFALSFFGLFEINLPNSWANKMDARSDKGGIIGIFFMALTLVIVSFSCTVGFMGTLINAVARGDSYLCPFMGFTGFGAGIALPFMLFAFFPSWLKSLPKSGGWMTTFKVTVAFLELALAVKFLANADNVNEWGFITREVFISLWVGIFAMLSFYLLGVFRTLHDDKDGHLSIGRILWATFFLSFTIYMIPGLWGAPLKIISSFPPPHHYAESPDGFGGHSSPASAMVSGQVGSELAMLESKRITGPDGLKIFKDDYNSALKYSKLVNKPLFIDFTGLACVNCRLMESRVWVKPAVKKLLSESVVIVSLYVDSKVPLPENEWEKVFWYGKERTLTTVGDKWAYYQTIKYKSNSQPQYVVLDGNEKMISNGTMGTELDENIYGKWLSDAVSEYKK